MVASTDPAGALTSGGGHGAGPLRQAQGQARCSINAGFRLNFIRNWTAVFAIGLRAGPPTNDESR